jgi:hypothetical protein
LPPRTLFIHSSKCNSSSSGGGFRHLALCNRSGNGGGSGSSQSALSVGNSGGNGGGSGTGTGCSESALGLRHRSSDRGVDGKLRLRDSSRNSTSGGGGMRSLALRYRSCDRGGSGGSVCLLGLGQQGSCVRLRCPPDVSGRRGVCFTSSS